MDTQTTPAVDVVDAEVGVWLARLVKSVETVVVSRSAVDDGPRRARVVQSRRINRAVEDYEAK